MPFELLHFNGSEKILKKKDLLVDVLVTLQYIDDSFTGFSYGRERLRNVLDDMGWIGAPDDMSIFDGRRFQHKGFKKRIAIEGNFSMYEYILEGLLRLQIAFDKKKIDAGILLLTAKRSEKSPYGSTKNLIEEDIKNLVPTITVPMSIALFDLVEIDLADKPKEKESQPLEITANAEI